MSLAIDFVCIAPTGGDFAVGADAPVGAAVAGASAGADIWKAPTGGDFVPALATDLVTAILIRAGAPVAVAPTGDAPVVVGVDAPDAVAVAVGVNAPVAVAVGVCIASTGGDFVPALTAIPAILIRAAVCMARTGDMVVTGAVGLGDFVPPVAVAVPPVVDSSSSSDSDALLHLIRLEERLRGGTAGGGGGGFRFDFTAGAGAGAVTAAVAAPVRHLFFFGGARRRRCRGMMLLLYSFCFLPKL